MIISTKELINKAQQTISPDGAVDITKLASDLNVKVYEYNFDEEVSGAVTKQEDSTIAIFINENDSLTRQRFSIAHELAHYVLHQEELNKQKVIHRKKDDKSSKEEEANRLAEQLLMPAKLVKSYLHEYSIETDTTISSSMIEIIANKFKVSKYVAIIRLRNLNYNVPYIYYT